MPLARRQRTPQLQPRPPSHRRSPCARRPTRRVRRRVADRTTPAPLPPRAAAQSAGARPIHSREPHAAEQLPEPLFEVLLELVDPRALLLDLSLRLCLDLGHPRPYRRNLGVDQRVDASAHLFLGGVDLRAELGPQPRRDCLIEVRAHGEGWMLQRAREPRFDIEIRDARYGAPYQIADRAVRESRVARPPHVARANREPRVNRVAVQTEAELRRGGARGAPPPGAPAPR